ncbi:hypothetical protein DFS34DRAFT_340754 [Phlyctochytrium arcticum]|nr:hypothetical protein DFS34DRAFT_340754 [Phlyctochytrium arcticum]
MHSVPDLAVKLTNFGTRNWETRRQKMSIAYLRPSPGEAERLKQEEQKRHKLERLQEVRGQERRIAAERRSRYKQCVGAHLEAEVHQLEADWRRRKGEKLRVLQDLHNRQCQVIGLSHQQAEDCTEQKVVATAHLKEITLQRQNEDRMRGLESQIQSDIQKSLKQAPMIQQRLTRERIKREESERAHLLAELYREALANTAPGAEVESQPLSLRLALRNMDRGYDKSCIHRDFAAVRCEPSGPTTNAWKQAGVAVAMRDLQERMRQERAERLKDRAEKRFEEALVDVQMGTAKDSLHKILERIYEIDRKRKAQFALSELPAPTEFEIEDRFGKMFRMKP